MFNEKVIINSGQSFLDEELSDQLSMFAALSWCKCPAQGGVSNMQVSFNFEESVDILLGFIEALEFGFVVGIRVTARSISITKASDLGLLMYSIIDYR